MCQVVLNMCVVQWLAHVLCDLLIWSVWFCIADRVDLVEIDGIVHMDDYVDLANIIESVGYMYMVAR